MLGVYKDFKVFIFEVYKVDLYIVLFSYCNIHKLTIKVPHYGVHKLYHKNYLIMTNISP